MGKYFILTFDRKKYTLFYFTKLNLNIEYENCNKINLYIRFNQLKMIIKYFISQNTGKRITQK